MMMIFLSKQNRDKRRNDSAARCRARGRRNEEAIVVIMGASVSSFEPLKIFSVFWHFFGALGCIYMCHCWPPAQNGGTALSGRRRRAGPEFENA